MIKNTPFPWHYFVRIIRARIILVILSSILTFVVCQVYNEYVFPKVLLVIFAFITLSIMQGYLRIIPFRSLLSKIEEIQVQLPHNKKLNIIYQKNEWVLLQEMLKLTEKYIREQKEQIIAQEQQSHTILQSIAEPVVLVDSFLSCKQYNQIFSQKFMQDKEAVVFREEKLWKIFDDQVLDLFQLAKNKSSIQKLKGYQIGDEYFNISVTPITDTESENLGLLGIFHNVTEAMLTEKMRVDFVANVSHEIRTPLTSIKGFSQLLLAQQDLCPEPLHSPLNRIVHNTERLKDLFDNLLKLSVIESKYKIEKVDFDLGKMLTTVGSNIKAKHMEKKIKFDFPVKMNVFGDPKLLDHVFTNLIDNSVKYNEKEEASIKVDFTTLDDIYRITILDNGPGISDMDIKRIFERFYRIQGKADKAVEGTGLGLSIVKHIINKHNGQVMVESEIGHGTTFTIDLPLA